MKKSVKCQTPLAGERSKNNEKFEKKTFGLYIVSVLIAIQLLDLYLYLYYWALLFLLNTKPQICVRQRYCIIIVCAERRSGGTLTISYV